MVSDSGSHRRELARIRARNVGYTVVQVTGFALVFWGLFELFSEAVINYYERQPSGAPDALVSVAELVPQLDQLSALVVFAAGAVVVWKST